MIIITCIILFCLLSGGSLSANEVEDQLVAQSDTSNREVKTGWNFGVLPGLSFDADKGFLYGLTANIYDYHDVQRAFEESLSRKADIIKSVIKMEDI